MPSTRSRLQTFRYVPLTSGTRTQYQDVIFQPGGVRIINNSNNLVLIAFGHLEPASLLNTQYDIIAEPFTVVTAPCLAQTLTLGLVGGYSTGVNDAYSEISVALYDDDLTDAAYQLPQAGELIISEIQNNVTMTPDPAATFPITQSGPFSVGPAANFPVVNPANSQLVVSRPYVYQASLTWTAPQTNFTVTTLTPPANVSGISFGNPTGQGIITVSVVGHTSGITYWSGQMLPGTLGLAPLILAGYETYDVKVTDTGSGTHRLQYAFNYDQTTVVPRNYGNTPMIVTPNTNTNTLTTGGGVVTGSTARILLGTAIALPAYLLGFSFSCYGYGGAQAQGTLMSLQGYVTFESSINSAARIVLCVVDLVSIQEQPATINSPPVAYNTQCMFPQPISPGSYINDPNGQMVFTYSTAAGNNLGGAAAQGVVYAGN